MRILFTFIGGLGHFHPLVPVARAARSAGHEVAVAGSGRLTRPVEAAGFRAFATSGPRPDHEAPPTRDPTPVPPVDRRAAEVEFAENFATKGAARHATALQSVIRDWRPDVVVRDEADLGSAVAAEVLGVPSATVLVLAAGTLIRPDLCSPPLQALRAEHGLPPDPSLGMLTRAPVLAPFPPSFRSPAAPLPVTGFGYRPGERVEVTRRAGRPRVYATLGTVFNTGSGDLFERLLAGLAGLDADVLLTVGEHVDPAEFGPQPDHVRVERYVDQSRVLHETDLVVSHGGSGSLMGALAHGLPSVLLPLGADQPHNAERAEDLGVARVLDASAATPAQILDATAALLADQSASARAQELAAEIAALPGVEATVPLLEGVGSADYSASSPPPKPNA